MVAPETFPITLADSITIDRRVVGSLDNNAWLITQSDGPAVLIDAADSSDVLTEMIGQEDLAAIITTHRHADHIAALAALAEATDADLIAGTPDCDAIETLAGVRPDGVWHGDEIEVGEIVFEVIGLVGHTPGSIALAMLVEGQPVHIFSGDSLFPGGVGKTMSPEAFQSLMGDVEAKIFDIYGDDTVILPGHGACTTLGVERPQLADWWARGW